MYYVIIAMGVVVITGTSCSAAKATDKIQSFDDVHDVITALQRQLEEQGQKLRLQRERHDAQFADMQQRNDAQLADLRQHYDAQLADVREELADVRQRYDDVRQENLILRQQFDVMENGVRLRKERKSDVQKGVISSFGCPTDEITLSCSDNKAIFIANAEYGQNYQSCAEGTCCPPHPYDCTQTMVDNNEADWAILKLSCDNQTSCSYLFQGSTFTDDVCTPLDSVAYLNVYYSCTPEEVTEPVGFTARTEETLTYNHNDVIQFPLTMSNFGGYYNPASGLFTCPYDGIYMFFSNIRSDDTNVYCRINKETTMLVQMYSLDAASRSNLVITGCSRGERVWVRQQDDNDVVQAGYVTTFSGFLLQRY